MIFPTKKLDSSKLVEKRIKDMKLLLEKYTKDGGSKEYPLEQSCKSVVISDCNGIPRIKITDDLEVEYLTHGKRLHKENGNDLHREEVKR